MTKKPTRKTRSPPRPAARGAVARDPATPAGAVRSGASASARPPSAVSAAKAKAAESKAKPAAKKTKAAPKVAATAKARARVRPLRKKRETMRRAKFAVGQVVKHRYYPFRGVIFDIDPVFANTDEWWEAIPEEIRPVKDQPFYHLLAENEDTEYIAYVSEQNLLPDTTREPLRHPKIGELFAEDEDGQYRAIFLQSH